MAKRTAVIDIGSNSVRMIILEKSSRYAFHLLHEVKSKVRISEGAYQNGSLLQDEAITRAVSALREFKSISDAYDVRKILCVATSAVRDASNATQFIKKVQKECQINIKVISGEREALLGGIACANLLSKTEAITLDIGGGSTECACIKAAKVLDAHSIDLGTVRLKELFFDTNDIQGATAYIDQALESFKVKQHDHLIGVGGTFRALAQILLKEKQHPLDKIHGFVFKAKELSRLGEKILAAPDQESLKKLGVKNDRFDVIKPGVLILLRVITKLGVTHCTASGVGVREGLYLSDLLRHNNLIFPANFNPSLKYLLDQYTHNSGQRALRVKLTHTLFDLMYQKLGLSEALLPALTTATKLSKVGASIHFYSYQSHSYYLTQTALEYGYSHSEITLISTLVRFQSAKKIKSSYYEKYQDLLPNIQVLNTLTSIMALAEALLYHHPRTIDYEFILEDDQLVIKSNKKEIYLAKEAVEALHDTPLKVLFH